MDSHEFQLDPLFEMLGVHGPARRTSLFYPWYSQQLNKRTPMIIKNGYFA